MLVYVLSISFIFELVETLNIFGVFAIVYYSIVCMHYTYNIKFIESIKK